MCLSRCARQPDNFLRAIGLQGPQFLAAMWHLQCYLLYNEDLAVVHCKATKAIRKVSEHCPQANTLVANCKAVCSCRQQRRRTKASYSAPVDVRDTVTRCIPLPSHWLAHHVRTSAVAEVLISPGSCKLDFYLALPTQRPVIWCRLKALSNRAWHWNGLLPQKFFKYIRVRPSTKGLPKLCAPARIRPVRSSTHWCCVAWKLRIGDHMAPLSHYTHRDPQ